MRMQRGFSLVELLIVIGVILVIAAIAIPNLLRARMAANDSGAASTIRTLDTAQVSYTTEYPTLGFSVSLEALGPGAPPGVDCTQAVNVTATSACLIDGTVGCSARGPCPKSGYAYHLAPVAAVAGTTVVPNYAVSAGPLGWYTTGTKNWCSTGDSVIRFAGIPQGVSASIAAAVSALACERAPFVPAQ
jgi:type IV pilus assembly protein PilA